MPSATFYAAKTPSHKEVLSDLWQFWISYTLNYKGVESMDKIEEKILALALKQTPSAEVVYEEGE